jgi:Ca-activated chloride channel homolog
MRNLTTVLLTLSMLAIGVIAQSSTSTRPRVAPTATPPRILNDPNKSQTRSGPPVLIGSEKKPPVTSATPPKDDDDGGVIRVETNLVTMPVSVLDREGRFISGLQQKDFRIFENGIEQKVDYFQSVEQPFTVILLIDVSPSTAFRIDEIQDAAISFVDQLRSGDRVMVVAFDDDIHVLSPVTSNRAQLRNAIRESRFGDGTSLYEAVDFALDFQLRQAQGRKAVVLFTDGVDTTSRRANYDSTLRAAQESEALFYPIRYDTSNDLGGGSNYPRGNSGGLAGILGSIIMGGGISIGGAPGTASRADYERGRNYLVALAENTGGREFEAQSIYNLDSAFSGIAEELRRQYSIGYYPENVGKVGDRKQIKIRVMRPGVVVRAKNSYIVGQTNRNNAGR